MHSWDSKSDESTRNIVSLNKDYISNNTINIPNDNPTSNINITNNIKNSYIVYPTLSNQDSSQNRNIVTNNKKPNTNLFKLQMRKYPDYNSISLII
jgi:hypothetical protein